MTSKIRGSLGLCAARNGLGAIGAGSAGGCTHLGAARNGLVMIAAQSFATGDWGPKEYLRKLDSDDLSIIRNATSRVRVRTFLIAGHAAPAACRSWTPTTPRHSAQARSWITR
jgi:hypothetical protein